LDPKQLRDGSIIFNIVHGTYGEDGTLQSELDALGRTYIGSDAAVSRLCMDKQATKMRLQEHEIRVPWGVRVDLGSPFTPKDLKLPHGAGYVMKPANDGSSVGLRMIANPSFILPTIEELLLEIGPRPYVIEERLPGPEFTVAVIDTATGPRALPAIGIRAEGVFDYHAKYQATSTVEEPVDDAELDRRLGELGVAAHRACGCRDVCRVDVMMTTDKDFAVLEVNTLPGMTERSLLPKAAAAAGIPFAQLVVGLVEQAAARRL
jgi:D-alanine-D-alanine ligase